jgi:hypothetical protein
VELEEKDASAEEDQPTNYNPQEDQDLFGSIFGNEGQTQEPNPQAAKGELEKAAQEMETPAGATPEESQADAIAQPEESDELNKILDEIPDPTEGQEPEPEMSLADLLGDDEEEEEPKKPFGNQIITEDEAVNMDRK